jgi:hypothetical protein
LPLGYITPILVSALRGFVTFDVDILNMNFCT